MSFMSVKRSEIQRAFGLAHRLSENEHVTPGVRKQAREIATAIWKACGEEKQIPAALPKASQERRLRNSLMPKPQTHSARGVSVIIETTEQCEYTAGVAQLFTLEETRQFVPGELIVCPE